MSESIVDFLLTKEDVARVRTIVATATPSAVHHEDHLAYLLAKRAESLVKLRETNETGEAPNLRLSDVHWNKDGSIAFAYLKPGHPAQ